MEKSKFVARYVGSMGGIAVLQVLAAFYLIAHPENLRDVTDAAAKLLPFLEPMPKVTSALWRCLGAAFLLVQAVSYSCAAFFPTRWPYRALCFGSSAIAAGVLVYLYDRDIRFAPILAGAVWQALLGLWVAWLLAIEIVQRPFAPPPENSSMQAAPSPTH